MSSNIIQQLSIYLKGGQRIVVPFSAEKADTLNPQIDAFVKALGDSASAEKNFLFQGARVVLVRMADVSAVDVVSLIAKEQVKEQVKEKEEVSVEPEQSTN